VIYSAHQIQGDAYVNTDGMKRFDRLFHVIRLFEENPGRGYRTREVAEFLGVNEDTASSISMISATAASCLLRT
jgi:hypothetical protein